LEIASGNYNTEDTFIKNIIETLPVKKNKIIAKVPSFGASYTWRYSYSVNGVVVHSPLVHFSTISYPSFPRLDPNNLRLRIIHPAEKFKDDYIFLDGNG